MEQVFQDTPFSFDRLRSEVRSSLSPGRQANPVSGGYLAPGQVYLGDARDLLPRIEPDSVALSVWSPPYFVGKSYEAHLSFEEWQNMLRTVISQHFDIVKPGGFLVVNINDILCFRDPSMPRLMAAAVNRRCATTREDVLRAQAANPDFKRHQLAAILGCSEQTVDRRLHGNNVRGGKYKQQTRVRTVAGNVEEWALQAGFYPYDRRVWVKDPCWQNSPWASLSYRSVDEFEYLYFFWKPGVTRFDRKRLTRDEWRKWGSRGVWEFASVRCNDDHEAKFPEELPSRVIRLLTDPNEIVLDCFLGSGTTSVAAIKANRQFIGIDNEERYVTLSRRNIAAAQRKTC